jgi:uncharacterized damage-inducible protein DinB
MSTTKQIAKHVREIYTGGNWTGVNLKDTLADVTWQQATTQVYSFNTIHTLVFHMQYYVDALLKVLHGGPLNAKDEYSFIHPPITNEQDWKNLLDKTFSDGEEFASLIEQLPDTILWENLADPKYGIYYRNLHGTIEHTNYHLGQIVLIKKIIAQGTTLGANLN